MSLAASFFAANIILAFSNQNDLAIYFVADIVIYLLVTLAIMNLYPRSMSVFRILGTVLFIAFLAIIILKIGKML
jgi:hypothetical protein